MQACKVSKIEWKGRQVYLGLDFSESNDNTSVAMVSVDDDNRILADVFGFIPEGRIDEKSKFEMVDYRLLLNAKVKKIHACGDRVIDYGYIEEFILSLEDWLGVDVIAVGYDRWNALSSAQKIEKGNEEKHQRGLNCVEIRQHSSVLHPPTKLLKEKILQRLSRPDLATRP